MPGEARTITTSSCCMAANVSVSCSRVALAAYLLIMLIGDAPLPRYYQTRRDTIVSQFPPPTSEATVNTFSRWSSLLSFAPPSFLASSSRWLMLRFVSPDHLSNQSLNNPPPRPRSLEVNVQILTESTVNPFAKRESHSKQQLLVYKVLTILTWILVVIVSIAGSFKSGDRRTIWGQNKAHPTPFSLNPFITDIYWRV